MQTENPVQIDVKKLNTEEKCELLDLSNDLNSSPAVSLLNLLRFSRMARQERKLLENNHENDTPKKSA